MRLLKELSRRDLVVFLGPGGVGKTTTAAAAALEAAKTRKTLVLTVDPARRLADALGVTVGNEATPVEGGLSAMMLDTKVALDRLVLRHAPDPDRARRILQSRFYRQLSDAFAGSEEFVAMGALDDILARREFDLVVVDTPPSQHAVDFLTVNDRLLRVYESGAVRYLVRPTAVLRLAGGRLVQAASRFTAQGYVDEVVEFLLLFDRMFLEMEPRVRRMREILSDPARTSLNLVLAPEFDSLHEGEAMVREVARRTGLSFSSVVVNRVFPARRSGAPRGEGPVAEVLAFYDALAAWQAEALAYARHALAAEVVVAPAIPGSVHDVDGLRRLADGLFRGRPIDL
ncbi:MAG: ArsA family ATPase [Methanobacteriota archaeon]